MHRQDIITLDDGLRERFLVAVHSNERVQGLTHSFYRYPARFSPKFASAAIECFSKQGDIVLDPYMGGGTTVVEALISGRRVIGNDLNSLSVFLTKNKITYLTATERNAIRTWARRAVSHASYYKKLNGAARIISEANHKNLNIPRSRFLKKAIAHVLHSIEMLEKPKLQSFARCILLDVAQWALDGRKLHTTLTEFRERLLDRTGEMLDQSQAFAEAANLNRPLGRDQCAIVEGDTGELMQESIFSNNEEKVDLVVTSPPYPGVHVLYHRWQVDGRKETAAPYWIAACKDGKGASFYNLGDRREDGLGTYFTNAEKSFSEIRRVMKNDALLVQLVAFSNPGRLLPRYLKMLERAGFRECFFWPPTESGARRRIWRQVPNRKWHANISGRTASSREVVLIHRIESRYPR